jgi:dihydroorotate dehydrogenase electron transfer subunit
VVSLVLLMRQSRLHQVTEVRMLSGGCFVLEVEGPIPETLAGQFYMLRTEHGWPVELLRPFSLYERSPDGESGSFLIKAVGPGTRALLDCAVGERVHVTGPHGQMFSEDIENPVCIAGGIGLAPFWLLAKRQLELGRAPIRLVFGGRNVDLLAGIDDFRDMAEVFACTDDGSHGFHGLVTEQLTALLADGLVAKGDTVFCCGPDPMMHAVAGLCEAEGLRCFLSLETYMACGYGVCNGCTVEVKGERFGGWPYSKTCIEGPVYEACELNLR